MWKSKLLASSIAISVLGLVLFLPTPALAQGWHRGWHGGGGGGWRAHPAPRVYVAPRYRAPAYGGYHGYRGPGAAYRPLRPVWVPGYWGWRGGTRIWIGGTWSNPPYAGGSWIAPQWVWNGTQWVWREGYWAPGSY